ncbi:MAG: hypothetical protein V3S38_01845, partial [Acidimicrobiia bacterium]
SNSRSARAARATRPATYGSFETATPAESAEAQSVLGFLTCPPPPAHIGTYARLIRLDDTITQTR